MPNLQNKKSLSSGFTLIELIISLSILVIIFSFSLPYYSSIYIDQQFNNATDEIIAVLRQTQSLNTQGYRDDQWGVYFDVSANTYTVFKGSTYSSTEAYNTVTSLSTNLFLGGLDGLTGGTTANASVLFSRLDGSTTNDGVFQLNSTNGDVVNININKAGMVSY